MFKRIPFKHLPHIPNFKKISAKIALGVIFVTFFFNYQPSFSFPPIKSNVAHAQELPTQTQDLTSKALDITFQIPFQGPITTYFSIYHQGIDLAAPIGTLIKPVSNGTVVSTGWSDWGYGLNVIVDHGHGYESLYAHMSKVYVKQGDKVTENDYLGEVGATGNATGPHTHLQIVKDGININPLSVLPEIPGYNPALAEKISSDSATLAFTPPTDTPMPQPTIAPKSTPAPTATPTPQPSALQQTVKISQEVGLTTSLPS
jgi:hypothetical protein